MTSTATALPTPLVSPEQLMAAIAAGATPLVVDCSFDLADVAAGERAYAQGHLPGAIYAHLDRDLCGARTGRNGRHPLPARADWAATLARLGVTPTRAVVVYDAQGGMYAARAWWMLLWAGHRDGTVRAQGRVQLGEANPNLAGSIVADKLQLFADPDRTLVLSGQARIANDNDRVAITGKFKVDRGLFDLPKDGAPSLGDDVVIVRRADAARNQAERGVKREEKPAGRFSPVVDVDVDFGDNFRFKGAGADLSLGGQMHVHSEPLVPLRGTGTIYVREGSTYEAFGRKLAIERGVLNFVGPINNPSFNITAMRRNQEVEAGVQVTGTVRQPRVKLVSEPNVPDEDKLSWLMFGYSASNAGLGQQQAMSGAALGLLGNVAGKNVARRFGLDEFSIGPSTAGLTDPQVVSLGKAISERITVGYEQSLSTADSIVKLTWQFSRRWSVVARGGTINGASVLFNKRW